MALSDNTSATWQMHCSTAFASSGPGLGNDRAMTGAVESDHQIAELKFGMAASILLPGFPGLQ